MISIESSKSKCYPHTFVEDDVWHRAAERYENFLRTRAGGKILFLEFGVGYNTPIIIKYPFWQMTAKNPNATYACINQGQAVCPQEIERQSVCINAELDRFCRACLMPQSNRRLSQIERRPLSTVPMRTTINRLRNENPAKRQYTDAAEDRLLK